ncbi:DUF1015 family protein [Nocardioides piscis]|uniref:DUF1015 domain-containing protein n=1 Tax=Nocardioides piscis TaxID=2714938 RepID=A0A6G7YHZ6_9ACTN|nr:DUF1015 family protein [Nocardioides piscis]QIK76423.1 DUF1015 domain-containing protein [Nocardioides piscis]
MDLAPAASAAPVAKPLRLEPFRAKLLAPARVGDPTSARAFARPYRAVSARLQDWEADGRLTHMSTEAVYVHEYTVGGLTVRGLVGSLSLANRSDRAGDRAIWPHEGIHPVQVGELGKRMYEMAMNPAPILLVHEGPPEVRALLQAVVAAPPDVAYLDRAGQQQRIWSITRRDLLESINLGLQDSDALVADGHHRYAAYLRLQEEHPGTPWDWGLAMLVDQLDTPLFLGAIHRSMGGVTFAAARAAALAAGAQVQTLPRQVAVQELAPETIVLADGASWAVLTPPPGSGLAQVEWLHNVLLPRLPLPPSAIAYHHTADEALQRADAHTVAVLLPALDFAAVRDLVHAGRLLPEKATSFQPKPSLGVLMRSLLDEPVAPS